MPYSDGFNTWFRDEEGNRVYIGPKIEFNVKGGEPEIDVTHSAEDAAKARAAGYHHISTTITRNGEPVDVPPPTLDLEPEKKPELKTESKPLLRRILKL
jgi:hypothetical protein